MKLTASGASGIVNRSMLPLSFSYSAEVSNHAEAERLSKTVGAGKRVHITEVNISVENTDEGSGGTDKFGGRVTIEKNGGAELTVAQFYTYHDDLGRMGGMHQVRDTWIEEGDIVRAYTSDTRSSSAAGYNINVAMDELAV